MNLQVSHLRVRLPEVDMIGPGRATGSRSSRSLVDRTRGVEVACDAPRGPSSEHPPSWTASSAGIIMRGMPPGLPTGVVTLLFTDVEGSTKLLREIGDAYTEALHEHRRVLRSAFAANHGVEIDTQGDAFFVAFARASDAVGAVADAQRALAGGPIRVRMGLHTGEPQLTEEGYVGLDVHKGARIAAAGHGGQVLLSQATRALVDAEVRDLGPHRLKDLSAPE